MHGNLNLWQILWESGPVVKAVLVMLVAFSVVSWAIVIQKYKEYQAISEANKAFLDIFRSNLGMSEIFQQAVNHQDSTMGMMYRKGYEEINKFSDKLGQKSAVVEYFRSQGLDVVERALKHGHNLANERLETRISTLATIGSIAPFVGLFGTVWGIIDAFSGLAAGGGSIEAVAPGIAEALVATAVGLAAAIPAVWFFNFFNNQSTRMNSQMESFGQDFLNLVERWLISSKA